MAKAQKWSVDIGGETHTVAYKPRSIFASAKITIDGKEYPLHSAKLFGASQEVFRLGGERAVISIDKKKKATITLEGELINEK